MLLFSLEDNKIDVVKDGCGKNKVDRRVVILLLLLSTSELVILCDDDNDDGADVGDDSLASLASLLILFLSPPWR